MGNLPQCSGTGCIRKPARPRVGRRSESLLARGGTSGNGGGAAAVGDEEEEPGARVAGLGVDVRRGGGAEWGVGGRGSQRVAIRRDRDGTARAREWD